MIYIRASGSMNINVNSFVVFTIYNSVKVINLQKSI